jgi:outer membrane protein OmpA-like peptidoglycan-associated protein
MNTKKVNVYVKGYGEYTVLGDDPQYTMFFTSSPSNSWKVKGDKIENLLFGAGLGIEWSLSDNFSISVNADLKTNADIMRYFVNGAVNYRLGSKGNEVVASADASQEPLNYSQEPEIVTSNFEPIVNGDFLSKDTYPDSFLAQDYISQTGQDIEFAPANTEEDEDSLIAAPPVEAAVKPIPTPKPVAKLKPQVHKVALKQKTAAQLQAEKEEDEQALIPERSPEEKAIENLVETKSAVELDQMTDDELLAAVDEESEKFKRPLEKKVNILVSSFKNNAVELTKEVKETVKKFADNIKQYAFKKVTVEGHSDSKGGAVGNFITSKLRARSVYAALREEGIPADKIEYKGVGSQKPATTNKTAYGQQENRRVEIIVE